MSEKNKRPASADEPTYEVPGEEYPPPPTLMNGLADLGSTVMGKVNEAVDAADFAGLSSSVSKAIKSGADSLSQALAKPSPYIVRAPAKRGGSLAKRAVTGAFALGSAVAAVGCFLGFVLGGGLEGLVVGLVFAAAAAGFGSAARAARSQQELMQAMDAFARIAGQREQVPLEELAAKAGLSMQEVTRQVSRGINEGYIPHGRIRGTLDGQTMLYLTDGAFRRAGGQPTFVGQTAQAQRSQQARAARQEEGMRQRAAQTPGAPQASAGAQAQGASRLEGAAQAGAAPQAAQPLDPRVVKTVAECDQYLARIREANQLIAEDEMSQKLARLEQVVRSIQVGVQNNPGSVGQLRQFTTYYLPTTGKLVDAYVDLERHGEHGPNAEQTRAEIKSTLDVINDSFAKLSDDLLQEKAWDLQSDMHVLRTMLTQDGLADDGGPRADRSE